MDIRDAMDIVEGRASPISVLYHCTGFEAVASITTNGLSPSSSRAPVNYPRAVYFSGEMETAGAHAAKIHTERKASGYVILKVKVSDLDPMLLGPDDMDLEKILSDRGGRRDWTAITWRESLKLCGQCTYRGWIPANQIDVFAAMPVGDRWARVERPLSTYRLPDPNAATPEPRL